MNNPSNSHGILDAKDPLLETRIAEELRRNGYAVIPELFSAQDVADIRREVFPLIEEDGSWYKKKPYGPGIVIDISPQRVAEAGMQSRLEKTLAVCKRPIFAKTFAKYLPRGAVLDRILVDRTEANPRPITEWHVDQQADNRLSAKFMVYLNHVTRDTGAFSYVPGSHAWIHRLMKKARLFNVKNTQVHDYSQIIAHSDRFGLWDEFPQFRSVRDHIKGDYESDDEYSLEGPPGTVIIFDTKGLHRGGVVRSGQRNILRTHYFEPEKRSFLERIKSRLF